MARVVTECAPARPALRRRLPVGRPLRARGGGRDRRLVHARGPHRRVGVRHGPVAGRRRARAARAPAPGRDPLAIMMNVTPEFASPIGRRSPADAARSAVVSSLADVILVSGPMAGAEPDRATLEAVREAVPAEVPVLLNTGARADTIADVPDDRRRLHRRHRPEGRRLHLEPGRPRPRPALRGERTRGDRQPMTAARDRHRLLRSEGRARVDLADGVHRQRAGNVELLSPHPGWAEADPGQWWTPACCCRDSREPVAAASRDVEASRAPGWCRRCSALDDSGRPLRRAILQNDARADAEVDELRGALADFDLLALTGSALTQQSVAPTLRWLAPPRARPVRRTTASLAGSYDWLARRSAPAPRRAQLGHRERAVRPRRDRPCDEVLARGEIPSGAAARGRGARRRWWARSAPAAAADTGLRAGTPIVVGGADHVSSAYGAGLIERRRLAREARRGGRHPRGQRDAAGRRAAVPRRPPGRRMAAQRLHGHQRVARALAGRVSGDADLRDSSTPRPPRRRRGRRHRLPALLPGGEVAAARSPPARRVRRPAPRSRAAATCTARRSRRSPSASATTSRCSPSAESPGGGAGHQRRQPLDAVEADPRRRARAPRSAGARPSRRILRRGPRRRRRGAARPAGRSSPARQARSTDRAPARLPGALRRALRRLSRARAGAATDLTPARRRRVDWR